MNRIPGRNFDPHHPIVLLEVALPLTDIRAIAVSSVFLALNLFIFLLYSVTNSRS